MNWFSYETYKQSIQDKPSEEYERLIKEWLEEHEN